ncbi:hypothetical protein A0H81_13968 [Grifola frondosa]|uniref:F-box domain-containing protein n=1 Tax=Grifola frondosa TaxID=5627 RepID=A0A1C7LPA0_GRIFR|nr:hypothetical protein A0H81_13968 [Grifola frondosa]
MSSCSLSPSTPRSSNLPSSPRALSTQALSATALSPPTTSLRFFFAVYENQRWIAAQQRVAPPTVFDLPVPITAYMPRTLPRRAAEWARAWARPNKAHRAPALGGGRVTRQRALRGRLKWQVNKDLLHGAGVMLEDISLRELASVLLCKAQEAASINAPMMSFDSICDLERIIASTLAMVRRVRNSCQRSISLPPEILSTIFQYVPNCSGILDDGDDDDPMWASSYVDTVDIIPLTHVCHRWREVALSTPSLWCSISDLDPAAFLERSGSMDLFLAITKDPKADHLIYDFLRSCGSRIRGLHWFYIEDTPLCYHLAFPIPRLRVLKIHCGYLSMSVESPGTFLFHGHTPLLEYASIRSCLWVPSESILSLTHLRLSDIPSSDANPGVDAILLLLSRTPNLEDLVITDQELLGSSKTSNMIRLKNLVRITFEAVDSRNISALIRRLEIGPSVAVQVFGCHFGRGESSLFVDLTLVPTSIEVARMTNSEVIVSAVNSSSAMRCISYNSSPSDRRRLVQEAEQYIRELWIRSCSRNVFTTTVARDWIHLETLVGCDYTLESVLYFLSTPLELPRARELSTIRLIQTSSRENLDLSVEQKIKEQFILARKDCPAIKLVIESHVLQRDAGHRVTGDVEALFESVEYKFFEEVPTMAYPDVCKSGWSAKYPPWVLDGQISS